MTELKGSLAAVAAVLLTLLTAGQAYAHGNHWNDHHRVRAQVLATVEGGAGATIGPDGAYYAVERGAGRIARIDPRSGRKSTFASGLPVDAIVGIGGAVDVAFIGRIAYVLVSVINEFTPDVEDGIFRVDGSGPPFEQVADVGLFSQENPPTEPFEFVLQRGVQFALQPARDGFVVSDGHHNRLLYASLGGTVSAVEQYGNVVPTGLEQGPFGTVYIAMLGASDEDGRVAALNLFDHTTTTIATGLPMIIDVQRGPDGRLYAISQGEAPIGPPGSPGVPNTGKLLRIGRNGTFEELASGLNQPTSLDFSCDDALVMTLPGEVLKFRNLAKGGKLPGCPGRGKRH